ncbi:hypothetical protein Tco_1107879 [Tanacetum coccineum]
MVHLNNLGPDLNEKVMNKTWYTGMIGSLMYLTADRPDIQFSTCLYVRYQANLKEYHLIAVKRIFRYLKGTLSLGLWYPKCSGFNLKGYLDSDYVRYNMEKKSTSGACQLLGGKLVCWSAKKRQFVAMSSAKAEYVPIFCDNTSAIAISNNPVLHSRTKHRCHFIKDHIIKENIELHFIPNQYQLANIFTEPLEEPTFQRLLVELGGIGEGGSNPQLSSVESSSHQEPVFSASTIIHSKSASGHDASTDSIAEADPRKSDPKDFVLVDKTRSAGYRLGTVQTAAGTEKEPITKKEFDTSPYLSLNSDEDDEKNRGFNKAQNIKLEKEKAVAEAKTALLSAQPSFLNVKELSYKVNEINGAAGDLKKYMKKLEIENINLDLPAGLLALPEFAHAIKSASQKASDQSVPLVGQADTHPNEEDKNTTQVTVTHLFQRRHEKNVESVNLNIELTIPEITTPISLIPTTTTALIIPTILSFQSPFISSLPKNTPQTKEVTEEESESDSHNEIKLTRSLVKTAKQKPLKNFTYINEKGETFQMTQKEIENQKGIEQAVKADAAKSGIKKGKKYLIDMLGQSVVDKVYKDKVKYDKCCLKMLNRRAQEEENVNDLHDYFKSTMRYKKSVQFGDFQAGTVLNEPTLGMIPFNSKQRQDLIRSGQNDLARTFSSFLVAEVDKRNLNPNKQMRLIE